MPAKKTDKKTKKPAKKTKTKNTKNDAKKNKEILKDKQRRETLRKKRLLSLTSVNLGNIGSGKKVKSMYEMMLEAGYSETSARQQTNVLAGLQDETVDVVDKLELLRQQAIEGINNNIHDADYKDMIVALDKLTKNIQLLSGKPTERHKHELADNEKKDLDNIFKEN